MTCPTDQAGKIIRLGDKLTLRNIGETQSQFTGGWVGCVTDESNFADWVYWPTTDSISDAVTFTINRNNTTDATGLWANPNSDPTTVTDDGQRVPVMYAAKGSSAPALYGLFTSAKDKSCQMDTSSAKWWAMGATAQKPALRSSAWAWKLRGFDNLSFSDPSRLHPSWPRTQLFFFPIKQQKQDNFVRYGDVFMIVPVRVNNAWKEFSFDDDVPDFQTTGTGNKWLQVSGFDNPYYMPSNAEKWRTEMKVQDPSALIGAQFYHFCFPPEGTNACFARTNGAFQYANPTDMLPDKITTCGTQCGKGIQYIPGYCGFYTVIRDTGDLGCTGTDDGGDTNLCGKRPCPCCKPGTTVCDRDGSVIVKCKWINESNPEELPVFDWACPCSADDACTDKMCPDKPCPDGQECIKDEDKGDCKCQPKKSKLSLGLKIVIGFGIALFVIVLVAFIFNLFKKKNESSPASGDGG